MKRVFQVEYDSGVAVAERGISRKSFAPLASLGAGVSRQDGDNFRRNMVTLQQYTDWTEAGATGVLGLAAAWACVNLLAGTIGSLPLMVYRTDRAGQRSLASDHSLYRILHDSPNADQTAIDFWEFISASVELRGNAYCAVERANDGRVIALDVPAPPELVSVKRQPNGSLFYSWTANGQRRDLDQSNVLHIRGFGGDPLGGMSTLQFGARSFGIALAIDRSAAATFANGIKPSGILNVKEMLKGDQRAQIEGLLQEKYMGAQATGVPMVLDNGAQWQQITINPDDAQMLESRAFGVEEVCRFFGVPPFMVGHTEKSTSWGTGIEQQTLGFVKFTLRRRLKRIEQALMKQLLTPRDRAEGISIEFNLEGLLRGDSAGRSAFYASGLQNGWLTINEVRALENRPPVEGGEVPRMQMQNVPITEAGQQPAAGV